MDNEKVYAMLFSKIYLLLVSKAEKKGRTKEEVDQIICWLTGYTEQDIERAIFNSVTYGAFFQNAPQLNPNRKQIKGSICGVRVEEIADPLMQEIRYLDKLIDELAKGKAMEKILRDGDETPNTIEEYIRQQPVEAQPYLYQINTALQAALPDAVQKISWGMPTYWKKRNLIHFAAFKKHVGLYPGPEAVETFADRLSEYKTSKGTIQFPYNKLLPMELITEIAVWCERMLDQNNT